jgi:hypothetical protein
MHARFLLVLKFARRVAILLSRIVAKCMSAAGDGGLGRLGTSGALTFYRQLRHS